MILALMMLQKMEEERREFDRQMRELENERDDLRNQREEEARRRRKEEQEKKEAQEKEQRRLHAEYERQKYEERKNKIDKLKSTPPKDLSAEDLWYLVEESTYYRYGDKVIGMAEVLSKAFENGANPNALSRSGKPLLNEVIGFAEDELSAKMIDCGADLSLTDSSGKNALIVAASLGKLPLVQKIAEKYPESLRVIDSGHNHALNIAALYGKADCVAYLADKCGVDTIEGLGCSPFAAAVDGVTCSMYGHGSFEPGVFKAMEVLVEKGAKIEEDKVFAALEECMGVRSRLDYQGEICAADKTIDTLINFIEKYNLEHPEPEKLLETASQYRNMNVIKYLVNKGVALKEDVSERGIDAPIVLAMKFRDKELFKQIMNTDVELNILDSTAGNIFKWSPDLETSCILLQNGAIPDCKFLLRQAEKPTDLVTPLGSSFEKLQKLSFSEKRDLFEQSYEICKKYPELKIPALKNMLDIYQATENPAEKREFMQMLTSIRRQKTLKDILRTDFKRALQISNNPNDYIAKHLGERNTLFTGLSVISRKSGKDITD